VHPGHQKFFFFFFLGTGNGHGSTRPAADLLVCRHVHHLAVTIKPGCRTDPVHDRHYRQRQQRRRVRCPSDRTAGKFETGERRRPHRKYKSPFNFFNCFLVFGSFFFFVVCAFVAWSVGDLLLQILFVILRFLSYYPLKKDYVFCLSRFWVLIRFIIIFFAPFFFLFSIFDVG